ncbi:DUF58 domain-containing protein [Paenibacillus athensensis]|uniref:DUF58 domain-containing protein n=1 Tax=Paenibacillus athensensis TaxID=1967502 RepID=A0A4Y8PSZ7_9BACL|nr:DUF58 domain-containing protein [Paenibacillus athensensis]MCD1261540.1 DUF58 domain-containing protein [Paenibacillus athensensis]
MSSGAGLLDPRLLARLDLLGIAAKTRMRGAQMGRRRSRGLGSSLEFADYRLYSPGDDPRRLDWNAYGRTGKPFIKLFMDEQELQVHVWLDVSASMGFGGAKEDAHTPENPAIGGSKSGVQPLSKLEYAKRLAAAIGYMALNRFDRVGAASFTDRIESRLAPLRGKGGAPRLFAFLEQCALAGTGDALSVFGRPGALPEKPGMTWLFSDFMYESGVREALSYLLAARQEVVVVQVLAREEVTPSLSGELKLIDSETGLGKEVALSDKVLKAYSEAFEHFTGELRAFCFERGIAYVLAVTDMPLEEVLLKELRRSGLLG